MNQVTSPWALPQLDASSPSAEPSKRGRYSQPFGGKRNRSMTRISLPGSLAAIPSRTSINTEKVSAADKTRKIQRGGL